MLQLVTSQSARLEDWLPRIREQWSTAFGTSREWMEESRRSPRQGRPEARGYVPHARTRIQWRRDWKDKVYDFQQLCSRFTSWICPDATQNDKEHTIGDMNKRIATSRDHRCICLDPGRTAFW